MNTIKPVIVSLTLALSVFRASAGTPDAAQEIIVALSPHTTAVDCSNHQALLQGFLVADAPNPSRVVVWDAWNLRVISDVQLPRLAYDSPAARARYVTLGLASLKHWCDRLSDNAAASGLKNSGAIKFPEWVQMATAQPAPGRRAIVVLANPFYISAEPSFSMIEDHYPADEHLNRTLAQTPYAPRRGLLAGIEVNWAYSHETIWTCEHHRYAVARWWGLWIGAANGRLVNFNSDAAQALLAATRTNHSALSEYIANTGDNALVMHTASKREIPLEIQQAPPVPPPPLPVQSVAKPEPTPTPIPNVATPAPTVAAFPAPVDTLPVPAQEPTIKSASEAKTLAPMPTEIPIPAMGNIGIAAVWSAESGTDIDLWVAAKPGLPEAYWHRPRVERVHYFRDIRTSQRVKENAQWRQAWEYVEIEKAEINEPTIWLNVYAASGPVNGIIRVQFNGRVVDRPFKFEVGRGNKGLDANHPARGRSPYWQEVKMADFFPDTLTQNNSRQP
jgi:hypothetical protein